MELKRLRNGRLNRLFALFHGSDKLLLDPAEIGDGTGAGGLEVVQLRLGCLVHGRVKVVFGILATLVLGCLHAGGQASHFVVPLGILLNTLLPLIFVLRHHQFEFLNSNLPWHYLRAELILHMISYLLSQLHLQFLLLRPGHLFIPEGEWPFSLLGFRHASIFVILLPFLCFFKELIVFGSLGCLRHPSCHNLGFTVHLFFEADGSDIIINSLLAHAWGFADAGWLHEFKGCWYCDVVFAFAAFLDCVLLIDDKLFELVSESSFHHLFVLRIRHFWRGWGDTDTHEVELLVGSEDATAAERLHEVEPRELDELVLRVVFGRDSGKQHIKGLLLLVNSFPHDKVLTPITEVFVHDDLCEQSLHCHFVQVLRIFFFGALEYPL